MNSALIVAAGKGTRMGADKLFLPLLGCPLIAHTWDRFEHAACIDEIILVVSSGREREFNDLAERFGFRKPYRLVGGGPERQDSVWNGLLALSPHSRIVAIQDGARPCTSEELIQATIQAAERVGAAVAAQKLTDTIKESTDGFHVSRTLDRRRLWSVQTPQAFRVEIILRALEKVRQEQRMVTDDTAACEGIGQPVFLVETSRPNPKATAPADMPYLEWLISLRKQGLASNVLLASSSL